MLPPGNDYHLCRNNYPLCKSIKQKIKPFRSPDRTKTVEVTLHCNIEIAGIVNTGMRRKTLSNLSYGTLYFRDGPLVDRVEDIWDSI